MNNFHHGFIGKNTCYRWVKGWNLQKLAQNAKKVPFGGEDDIIGQK